MNLDKIPIDYSDIPETKITESTKIYKNPYAERIRKNGYSITVHYSPEDVATQIEGTVDKIMGMDVSDLDEDERKAFEKYLETNKAYIS